jgi:hypothetical protein
MCAQSIGCSPIEALCLGPGKYKGRFMAERGHCEAWKSDHFGKVDDPPDYGEHSRDAYEAEEGLS